MTSRPFGPRDHSREAINLGVRRVADLNQDVVEALAKVRTTATEGQYASSLRAYVTFCNEFNCTGSEVADEHWARYAGWRYRLRDLVAEMQRDPAITNEEKVLYRAMYTGAMFGFLRVSEFIRGGAGGCENPPLQVKHVQFLVHKETGKRMCVLTLPPTKTDQSGNEENFRLALGELGEEDAEICPYRAMWALIQLKGRHANGDEDLFTVPHRALHFDLGLQGLLTVSLEKLTARICE